MKSLITSLLSIFLAGMVHGQIDNSDIDLAQSIFGKSKRLIVGEYIQPGAEKKDAFWKMYDQYEAKRKLIEKQRFLLLKEYADKYQMLDATEANKLIRGFMSTTDEYNKLHKIYFKKAERVLGSLQAATFIQLEIFIQTSIQSDLQSQIPVIGELEKISNQENEQEIENVKG